MGDLNAAVPGVKRKAPITGPLAPHRSWYADEIVVSAFAFFGVGGGVMLPLLYGFDKIPPITASFLLATGLAALTYRYLGGIEGASFSVGALKLGGALAALVGIATLINHSLAPWVRPPVQPPPAYQIWTVTGQVTDASGNPIDPLTPTDVSLSPPQSQLFRGGNFKMDFYIMPSNTISPFPTLYVSHDGYETDPIDLNPNATTNDVQTTRSDQTIKINAIKLKPQEQYHPSPQAASPVPLASEPSPGNTEQHPRRQEFSFPKWLCAGF